jgi:hypothetical protein
MRRENQARLYDWVAGEAGGVAVPGSLARALGGRPNPVVKFPIEIWKEGGDET